MWSLKNFYSITSHFLLLHCISDETRNFYNDVQTATTSGEFSDLKSQATSSAVFDYSEQQDEGSETTSSSSYKVSKQDYNHWVHNQNLILQVKKQAVSEDLRSRCPQCAFWCVHSTQMNSNATCEKNIIFIPKDGNERKWLS